MGGKDGGALGRHGEGKRAVAQRDAVVARTSSSEEQRLVLSRRRPRPENSVFKISLTSSCERPESANAEPRHIRQIKSDGLYIVMACIARCIYPNQRLPGKEQHQRRRALDSSR